jgi:hypothetical protein
MNYYDARQRNEDKRWDYTCRNDDRIWPVGYCHTYVEPEELDKIWPMREEEREKHVANKHKYHTTGHATAEEACECYREYLLDQELRLGNKWDSQHHCEVCDAWTDMYAEVGHTKYMNLCEAHNNREEVEKLFKAPGWICCS